MCAAREMVQTLAKGLNGLSQGTLWLGVLLTPAVAVAGGLGFQATLGLLGLSAILAFAADQTGADYLRAAWPFSLLAFVAWAWVSSLWSGHSGENAALLFGLLIPLLFVPLVFTRLSERAIQRLTWAVIVIGLLGVILLFIDAASGFALSLLADPVEPGGNLTRRIGDAEMNVGRGQVSYALILWPVAGLLISSLKRGWILAMIFFIGLAISAQFNNLAVIIPTLLIAWAFAVLAWRNPRLGLIFGFSLAIASLIFAPLLPLLCGFVDVDLMRKLPLSWEHRVRMWDYAGELIQQAPLIGHGFDASRLFNELTFRAPDGRDIVVLSMHPHNIGLQIWLETGVVGVLLAVGFLLALLKTALKICTSSARGFSATGLIVTVATSGAVTVGVWQHWWWALIVFSVSLISLIPLKMNAR